MHVFTNQKQTRDAGPSNHQHTAYLKGVNTTQHIGSEFNSTMPRQKTLAAAASIHREINNNLLQTM